MVSDRERRTAASGVRPAACADRSRARTLPPVIPRPAPAWLRAARRALLAVALGALGLAALGGASLSSATPALAAAGPLPPCRYDDVLTEPEGYDDWSTTLVDPIFSVPASYVPPDLVSVSTAGISGSGQVRALVIPDLAAMTKAAKAAGNPIAVQSAYRSYATQQTTFNYWVKQLGRKKALLLSARPGHSEHQLGVAIDFKSAAGGPAWSGSDWGQSPAGSWLRKNSWKYGFIQSYPKGKQATTCYEYESWHFRYVGRAEAAAIHASGLTTRQYLWAHFTTASAIAASPAPSASTGTTGSSVPSEGPNGEPTFGPSSAASFGSSASPASAGAGSPSGVATGPPISPAGTVLGADPTTVGVGVALVLLALALAGSMAMTRRRPAVAGQGAAPPTEVGPGAGSPPEAGPGTGPPVDPDGPSESG